MNIRIQPRRSHQPLIDAPRFLRRYLPAPLAQWLNKPFQKTFGVPKVNDLYARVRARSEETETPFLRAALDELNIRCVPSDDEVERISESGGLVVVSNHPFGGIEGMILAELVGRRRDDVKILGNFLLQRIPELSGQIIAVDPFGKRSRTNQNAVAIRQAIAHVKSGGALIVFPSSEISHLDLQLGKIVDPPWSRHVAAIVRRSRAAVLPAFFTGHNGKLFQSLAMLHPKLQTALLPRQLMDKENCDIDLRIGKPLRWKHLKNFESDEAMTQHLRLNAYLLEQRGESAAKHAAADMQPIAPPVATSLLEAELDALPEEAKLAEAGSFAVYATVAWPVPHLMREIGRLREVTFRTVGEGTGKPSDLDRFDDHYHHLVLWDHEARQLVGAYRMGVVSEILDQQGPKGLYTSTLFSFKPKFLKHIRNSVELGRSFVREEYQRQPTPLSLLWKGVGLFLMRYPGHHQLFGPVSISHDYLSTSQNLMVQFLEENRTDKDLARQVSAKKPFHGKRPARLDPETLQKGLRSIEDVSLMVSEMEQDGKGVPVLLRQYLKLNATLLSFNVDPEFTDCLDGLILVDLHTAPPRMLSRFFGPEAAKIHAPKEES